MACSSSCSSPGAHSSWGECVRAKGLRVGWANSAAGMDASREKAWDRELANYKDARAQGIQPRGTSTGAVREAVDASDAMGVALDMGSPTLGMEKL